MRDPGAFNIKNAFRECFKCAFNYNTDLSKDSCL